MYRDISKQMVESADTTTHVDTCKHMQTHVDT